MGRGKAAFKQQAHRVTFVAEGGLQADEDITQLAPQHKDIAPVALHLAGGGAPDGFDDFQGRRVAHNRIGIHKSCHVGGLAIGFRIAAQDSIPQVLHRFRHIQRIAVGLHGLKGVVQALKHRQISRRARSAGIWREAEQNDTHLLICIAQLAQFGQALGFFGQRGDAFGARRHGAAVWRPFAHQAAPCAAVKPVTARKDGGVGCPVNFGQGDEHRGFNRAKTRARVGPLAKSLEFQRMCCDIGHVQFGQGCNRCRAVIIGGATDQRKAGQRDHGIHTLAGLEIGVDRGSAIKPASKGGNAGDAARFKRGDDGVVMGGVRRQHIRAQHQEAHGQLGPRRAGQVGQICGDAGGKFGVIQPNIGVIDRSLCHSAAPIIARGVAADQEAHHLFDVVIRPAQPILHRQEPSPQILRLTGDPAQDLGQTAQHRHLLFARVGRGFGRGFQLFQKLHRHRGGLGHIQVAHLGQLDDGAVGHNADESIRAGAGFFQIGQDGGDMLFDEKQVGHNDVSGFERLFTPREGSRIFGPFGGGVNRNRQAGEIFGQARSDACGGASGVLIKGDHNNVVANARAIQGGINAHNVPLPRTRFRQKSR